MSYLKVIQEVEALLIGHFAEWVIRVHTSRQIRDQGSEVVGLSYLVYAVYQTQVAICSMELQCLLTMQSANDLALEEDCEACKSAMQGTSEGLSCCIQASVLSCHAIRQQYCVLKSLWSLQPSHAGDVKEQKGLTFSIQTCYTLGCDQAMQTDRTAHKCHCKFPACRRVWLNHVDVSANAHNNTSIRKEERRCKRRWTGMSGGARDGYSSVSINQLTLE